MAAVVAVEADLAAEEVAEADLAEASEEARAPAVSDRITGRAFTLASVRVGIIITDTEAADVSAVSSE